MLAYFLILLGFSMRLLPLDHNMAPIASIAVFSGAYLDRRIAPWVGLAVMVGTDIILGLHDIVFFTWGAFIFIGFLGMILKEKKTPSSIFLVTVSATLIFFVISNFGVWLAWYPRTIEGMANCYMMALPFLRNSLAGNMVFSIIAFGVYEILQNLIGDSKYANVLLGPVNH